MSPKRLRNLADDPRFISGIYNYCDRWCERCPFTRQCLNFAMQQADGLDSPEARDVENQEFWDKLGGIFQQTIELIKEAAQEAGVDLSSPDLRAAALAHERQVRRREAKKQALPQAAMAYLKAVDRWLEDATPAFAAKGLELETEARLEIGDPEGEAARLAELVEVIRWYQHFIYVKLSRAIGSRAEEQLERDPEMRAFPKDSDGTAKVALISIDRSIAAWAALRELFPEHEGSVLELLRKLGRVRTGVEAMFPQARAFICPGLDEPQRKPGV
ncbi:MAG: hypothetical protein QOE70_6284 [Chthoniobacter sp.]|jgi:hypothetical protein|nr:hypothetical protein [Chthoniobacter sp.]